MGNLSVISSWSGGKDSCLACYKAMQKGHEVKFLLNFASVEYKRCCFHGIENRLMQTQADSIEIPMVQREVPADMEEYEKEFKSAVCKLKKMGMEGMVFGDIYLDEHKEWVDRVCRDINITPIEPLWNLNTEDIIMEFINSGFKAIVVSAKSDLFGEDFVGRLIDKSMVDELKQKGICLCGENGEFHTFVIDGPIFKKRIEILESAAILKKGFWEHWFLDIKRYRVIDKVN